MRTTDFRALVAPILLIGAIACRDSTGPSAEPTLEDALEQIAGTETLAGPGTAMMGGMAIPHASPNASCTFDATEQRFECVPVTSSGFTWTRWYQLLDGSGSPLAAWGPNVAAVRSVTDFSGERTTSYGSLGQTTITVTQHDDAMLSGLGTGTNTLTGTATSTMTQSQASGTTTWNSTRTTHLTRPARAGEAVYPTGTITTTMSQDGSALSMTVTMTWNGTSVVRMRMTSTSGMTIDCTFDMAAPSTPPTCS